MPNNKTPLQQAQRHIAIDEGLVTEQRAIIERLRDDGHVTHDAEQLLAALEKPCS